MERSLESGRFVFMEAMLKEGHIDQTEYDILDEWFTWLKQKNPAVDEIIYLRSTPAIALQRLLNRNRIEESSVTLSYLSAIHKLYDNWLFNTDIPVTVINQDQTLEETLSAANQLAIKFKSKIWKIKLKNSDKHPLLLTATTNMSFVALNNSTCVKQPKIRKKRKLKIPSFKL